MLFSASFQRLERLQAPSAHELCTAALFCDACAGMKAVRCLKSHLLCRLTPHALVVHLPAHLSTATRMAVATSTISVLDNAPAGSTCSLYSAAAQTVHGHSFACSSESLFASLKYSLRTYSTAALAGNGSAAVAAAAAADGAPAKVAVCVVRLFPAAYGGKSRGGQSRLNGKGLDSASDATSHR